MYQENIIDEQKLSLLKKRLSYRACKRGCKENDIILGNYIVKNLDNLDLIELNLFSELLDCADNDIFEWVTEKKPLPKRWQNSLMTKIIQFTKQIQP